MKKILIAILMFCCVPMFARGDEPEILNKTVPFSRLYKMVQKYNELYDSDFVFFLEKQILDGKYTLGNLARACVNYTTLNSAVTKDTCKRFMNNIIGKNVVFGNEQTKKVMYEGRLWQTVAECKSESAIDSLLDDSDFERLTDGNFCYCRFENQKSGNKTKWLSYNGLSKLCEKNCLQYCFKYATEYNDADDPSYVDTFEKLFESANQIDD